MPVYRFSTFQFDSSTGELRRPGRLVRLRPQAARAFTYLLERQGELVSREELQRVIWPEGTFVHFDYGLNSCLRQIRAALGESASTPVCIETLVKRGFRFTAPVSVIVPFSRESFDVAQGEPFDVAQGRPRKGAALVR